jgi:hypothetical protein
MTSIVLSDEQSRLLLSGSLPVVVLDSRGRKVAEITSVESPAASQKMTDAELIAEAKRRMERAKHENVKCYTTAEVLERLRAVAPE